MTKENSGRHAVLVGAGIFLSRIMGLVRQRVFSHYFGLSDTADAFSAALRIPNFLQNLFGEGVLSASFIPVYARLLAEGKEEDADRVAGAVAAILALGISLLVLLGVIATPYLLAAIAPGYSGDKRELTILLVRILFPGTGLLVASAWCLGILNSHRKFFLSYAAPVVWNLSMIATLLIFRHAGQSQLAVYLAWGTVLGCLLQCLIQIPSVLAVTGRLRVRPDIRCGHVREVFRNFGSVAISRGVVQISAYVDQAIASLLGQGAVAAMTTASTLYMLPVSLFGMAVSAAELPAMSRSVGQEITPEVAQTLRQRLDGGLRRIAFFIVPSAVAFMALGDIITAALYQSGQFTRTHSVYVWGILAGSGVGLLASTLGRLYSSTHYALRDTRTPLRFALVRLSFGTALGLLCALWLPRLMGLSLHWGAVGLTAASSLAGWVEFSLLRRALNRRIGATGLSLAMSFKLWSAALAAAGAVWLVKLAIGHPHPIVQAVIVLGTYGCAYFALTFLAGVEMSRGVVMKIVRRVVRR